VVVFPSDFAHKKAVTIAQLPGLMREAAADASPSSSSSFPLRSLRRVLFLEGTWEEGAAMAADARLAGLVHVRLDFGIQGSTAGAVAEVGSTEEPQPLQQSYFPQQPSTAFWRHQRLGKAFLSSIEAVHATLQQLDQAGLLLPPEETACASTATADSSVQLPPQPQPQDPHRFDNLLWLFALTYERVLAYYRAHPQLLPAL